MKKWKEDEKYTKKVRRPPPATYVKSLPMNWWSEEKLAKALNIPYIKPEVIYRMNPDKKVRKSLKKKIVGCIDYDF